MNKDLIVTSRRKSEASECWYEDGEGVMDEGGMGGRPCLEDEAHAHVPLVTRGLRWVRRRVLGVRQKRNPRGAICLPPQPSLSRAFVGPNESRTFLIVFQFSPLSPTFIDVEYPLRLPFMLRLTQSPFNARRRLALYRRMFINYTDVKLYVHCCNALYSENYLQYGFKSW